MAKNTRADPAAHQNFRRIEELLYAQRNAMHFGIGIGKRGQSSGETSALIETRRPVVGT